LGPHRAALQQLLDALSSAKPAPGKYVLVRQALKQEWVLARLNERGQPVELSPEVRFTNLFARLRRFHGLWKSGRNSGRLVGRAACGERIPTPRVGVLRRVSRFSPAAKKEVRFPFA
jgi:hypothetical protein